MSVRTSKPVLPKFALAFAVTAFCATFSEVLAQRYDDGGDLSMRVEQLESQLRRLTGQNEELQHRNRVLEQQLQQLQGGAPAAPAGPAPGGSALPTAPPRGPTTGYGQPPAAAQQPVYGQQPTEPVPLARGPGRGDAFDPTRNPNAPGAPRVLGSTQQLPPEQVGAAGGRDAGDPLNLSNVGAAAGPPAAGDSGLTTAPPSQTPRDEFDLGIGYMQRKDYALAEETMRNFTRRYPNDQQVADAQFWLGESLFQRQKYREAAEAFLAVTSKYDTSAKAPDALLRLGQSLAALKEKEAACAALGEVARKYPQASRGVKQAVDREQKRVKC